MNADPAVKYAGKVSPEHEIAMQSIGLANQIMGLHREQFEKVLRSERDMHNFGGMLDPTLYRDMLYSDSFKQQIRLIKAALAFLDEVGAVAKEIGA